MKRQRCATVRRCQGTFRPLRATRWTLRPGPRTTLPPLGKNSSPNACDGGRGVLWRIWMLEIGGELELFIMEAKPPAGYKYIIDKLMTHDTLDLSLNRENPCTSLPQKKPLPVPEARHLAC